MDGALPLVSCLALAIGVCLLLRHGSVATRGIGVALSVGGFLGVLGAVSEAMGPAQWSGEIVFFYIFSAVGIASAIRMIYSSGGC